MEEAVRNLDYTYDNLPRHLRDLGRLYLRLGEEERARDAFQKAAAAPGGPLAALEARLFLAYLDGDQEALARLLAQAELWESPPLVERGRSFLAQLSQDPGVLAGLGGFFPSLTRALLLQDP
ncbi:hypothetical protein L6232_21505, partial [Shewanella sp. C31]|nr:hypothetical protein [Shewanella electrica]